jgi:hypothetical protein
MRYRKLANGYAKSYSLAESVPLIPLLCRSLFFHFDHFTDGRTPWTSDQLVARPLPKHRTTQTQNKHIPIIYASCGIRTHDPGFRTNEDSTFLRAFGYRERRELPHTHKFYQANLMIALS